MYRGDLVADFACELGNALNVATRRLSVRCDRVELKIEDVAFGGKASHAMKAKRSSFLSRSMANASRPKSCARKSNSPKGNWSTCLSRRRDRVVPDVRTFGRCGGCSYQHISYEHQLELKARQVEQAMRRIGRLAQPPMRPIIPSPSPTAIETGSPSMRRTTSLDFTVVTSIS